MTNEKQLQQPRSVSRNVLMWWWISPAGGSSIWRDSTWQCDADGMQPGGGDRDNRWTTVVRWISWWPQHVASAFSL